MPPPITISGDDLVGWSGLASAKPRFPLLVRKIVASAAPAGAVIQFRADSGVQLSGFDGFTNFPASVFPVPAGPAVWELSTKIGPEAKAEEDYTKRTAAPGTVQPSLTAYIAVTSRRWPGKTVWQTAKQAEGVWASVMAFDADDLSHWLENAPAVASWFAFELGRPVQDSLDLERVLADWSRRTEPALPLGVLSAGREAEVRAIRDWARRPPSVLRVRAETREEALAFVAAALALETNADWNSRALVVRSRNALDWALQPPAGRPLVVLAEVDGYDRGSAGLTQHLAIAFGADAQPQMPTVVLPSLDRRALGEVLAAVLEPADADRRAQECGGSAGALQRLLGYAERPSWAMGSLAAETRAVLLAGAWTPASQGDCEIVSQLSGGRSSSEVDAACSALSAGAGAPLRRQEDSWTWRSPPDAWRLLVHQLTEVQAAAFAGAAVAVLSENDPAAGAATAARLALSMRGPGLRYSGALRTGIARSLALLAQGTWGRPPVGGPAKRRAIAQNAVRQILDGDWRRWASAHSELPVLAEAAPEAFLDRLEASIAAGDEGVCHLLAIEGGVFGPTPHTGLLWGLEILAWEPVRMSRVVRALGRLAARDPGGQVANRPLRSLVSILRGFWPQTLAPSDARLQALRGLVAPTPGIAWQAGLALLPSRAPRGTLDDCMRPSFIQPPVPGMPRTVAIDVQFSNWVVDFVIELAASDISRWSELIHEIEGAPQSAISRVLRALSARLSGLAPLEAHALLWATVRSLLTELLRLPRYSEPMAADPELVALARQVYRALEPPDLVRRLAWLFTYRTDLPEENLGFDWRAAETRHAELRVAAMEEIVSLPGLQETMRALLGQVERPALVGQVLAQVHGAQGDILMLAAPPPGAEEPYREALAAFVDARSTAAGAEWVEQTLRQLESSGRRADAVRVALALNRNSATWAMLEAIGPELAAEYWRTGPRLYADASLADVEACVRNLVQAGAVVAALETLNLSTRADQERPPPNLAIEVLEACIAHPEALAPSMGGRGNLGFLVQKALQLIGDDQEVAAQRVWAVEVFFLPVLEHSWGTPRVNSALGDSPELWAELVQLAYIADEGGETETAPEVASDREETRRSRAHAAHSLLTNWGGCPGETLPPPERDLAVTTWVENALIQLNTRRRVTAGLIEIGKLLARVPPSDGVWPCLTARSLIEADRFASFPRHLEIAKSNLRGVTHGTVGDGGVRERALAQRLRGDAERLASTYPSTGALLGRMAEQYEREGERMDLHDEAIRES